MGCQIQPARDIRIGCYLAHEDKERDNRKAVGGKRIEKIPYYEATGCRKRIEVRETKETDYSHAKGYFNAR
jgi:hypothetical protein